MSHAKQRTGMQHSNMPSRLHCRRMGRVGGLLVCLRWWRKSPSQIGDPGRFVRRCFLSGFGRISAMQHPKLPCALLRFAVGFLGRMFEVLRRWNQERHKVGHCFCSPWWLGLPDSDRLDRLWRCTMSGGLRGICLGRLWDVLKGVWWWYRDSLEDCDKAFWLRWCCLSCALQFTTVSHFQLSHSL